MATGDVLSIINRALLAIGSQSQVSNLNEGSTEANAANVLYTPTFEALARSAYWNCLRNQGTLTLLAAAQGTPENPQGTTLPFPPNPWLYSYALPSDSLMARFIVPSLPATPTGSPPISPSLVGSPTIIRDYSGDIPFRVGYATDINGNPIQIVLTNESQAQLVYTVNQPNPQIWDSSFQAAMVASLAAYLVPALSLNMSLGQMQVGIAKAIINDARVRDSDEGTTSQDNIPDWIKARNAGGAAGNCGYNASSGYSDIFFGY